MKKISETQPNESDPETIKNTQKSLESRVSELEAESYRIENKIETVTEKCEAKSKEIFDVDKIKNIKNSISDLKK